MEWQAIHSDHGYPIISMFHTSETDLDAITETELVTDCQLRKEQGYNSGMGEIFRHVAAIDEIRGLAPAAPAPSPTAPSGCVGPDCKSLS